MCGGRLNGQKICTECGLDNTKCDKEYKVNQNICDGEPLTHVHNEEEQKKRGRTGRTARAGYRKQPRPERGRAVRILTAMIVIIVLVGAAGPPLIEAVQSMIGSASDSYEFDYDPYEYTERELSETGETYDASLGQGEYLVGLHLPEGAYTVSSAGDYVSVNVDDDENSIWLYINLDSETPRAEDIRLYKGARVQVHGDADVSFSTQNAQLDERASMENPLTEEVLLSRGWAEAGVDFEAGVYDVYAKEDYGSLDVTIYDEQGEEWETQYIWLDADSDAENVFRNLVLPQGALISCEDGLRISLKPSEVIASEDYMSYYLPR